jgi:hypothetical protein
MAMSNVRNVEKSGGTRARLRRNENVQMINLPYCTQRWARRVNFLGQNLASTVEALLYLTYLPIIQCFFFFLSFVVLFLVAVTQLREE